MSILTCFNHDCFSSNMTSNASILTQSQCYLMDSNAEIKGRLRFQQKGDRIEVEVIQRSPAEVMGEAMRTAFETIASNCSAIANKGASIVNKCGSIASNYWSIIKNVKERRPITNNSWSMVNKCGSIASNYFSHLKKYESIVSNNLTSFKKCVPIANNLLLFSNNSCSSSNLSNRSRNITDLTEGRYSKKYRKLWNPLYLLPGIFAGAIAYCMYREDKAEAAKASKKNKSDIPLTSGITPQPKCSNSLDHKTPKPLAHFRANKSTSTENA